MARGRGRDLAVFDGARLLDRLQLLLGAVTSNSIIIDKVLAAVSHLSHQADRFFAKLIAAVRYIVAIAERLPVRVTGAATK